MNKLLSFWCREHPVWGRLTEVWSASAKVAVHVEVRALQRPVRNVPDTSRKEIYLQLAV